MLWVGVKSCLELVLFVCNTCWSLRGLANTGRDQEDTPGIDLWPACRSAGLAVFPPCSDWVSVGKSELKRQLMPLHFASCLTSLYTEDVALQLRVVPSNPVFPSYRLNGGPRPAGTEPLCRSSRSPSSPKMRCRASCRTEASALPPTSDTCLPCPRMSKSLQRRRS